MVTNIFVYIVSVFFTDRYVLMSFPVMAAYIYNSIINYLEARFISSEKEQYLDILQIVKLDTIINGNSFFLKEIAFLYILIMYIAIYKVYCIKVNKDGE